MYMYTCRSRSTGGTCTLHQCLHHVLDFYAFSRSAAGPSAAQLLGNVRSAGPPARLVSPFRRLAHYCLNQGPASDVWVSCYRRAHNMVSTSIAPTSFFRRSVEPGPHVEGVKRIHSHRRHRPTFTRTSTTHSCYWWPRR